MRIGNEGLTQSVSAHSPLSFLPTQLVSYKGTLIYDNSSVPLPWFFLPAHSDGPIDHRCGQWALYTNTLWDLKHLKHYQAVRTVKGLSSGLTYCKRPSQLFTVWACNLQHDTGLGFFTFVFSLISFPLCKSSADFLEVSLCTWDMWNVGIIF